MNAREVAELIAARAGQLPRNDGEGGFRVICPAHDDHDPSLHISAGKRQAVLLKCHAGCATADVLAEARISWNDVCGGRVSGVWFGPTEEYSYVDSAGRRLFTVCRAGQGEGRRFCAYRYGNDGEVVREVRTMPRVLYHLPEVVAAVAGGETIYLCEGEKDADRMRSSYGVTATTNSFGATAWAKDSECFGYAEQLRGATVIVVQHDDPTGRRRTRQILTSLRGVAAGLSVVRAASGNDAYDHIAAGHGLDEFVSLSSAETDVAGDGGFAALPNVLFDAARACNLTHLDYHVFIEIARCSVRREDKQTLWQTIPCPSSWLAKCCGNASASAVRSSLSRLRGAGLLLEECVTNSTSPPGSALRLRVNDDYQAWRPLSSPHSSRTPGASSARTASDSCKDTSTREDFGVREEGRQP